MSSRLHKLSFAAGWLLPVLLCSTMQAQLPAGTRDSTSQAADPHTDAQAALRAQANEALDKQDYPRALKLLLALTDQNPPDPHLLYDLAYTQDALDQTSNAEATYRRAAAADRTLIEPHLGLGLLLARTGHADEAHAELTTAATLNGDQPALRARAYRALARLDQRNNPEAAREELLDALKLTPETTDDTAMAAELAESAKDPAAAEKAYRRVLADNPDDPSATASLAHLVARDNPTEAVALLESALAAHPGDAALIAQLATLYANQDKYDEAIALVEPLHAAHPEDANLSTLLAHLYSQSGNPAKADPLYAAVIAVRPSAVLLDDRGEALTRLHRYAEAEALLKRAVADPTDFHTQEAFGLAAAHLAFAASNNNDPQTVLRALALRATVLPQSPSSLFLAATAHDKLHEVKQAVDLYNQFLAAAQGKFPDEEFEARHRLITLAHMK